MKTFTLRLLLERCRDPYHNLAVEEAILSSVNNGSTSNTLRLWIDSPSAIIGSNQRVESAINFDFCIKSGVDVVRRLTGGGAVYHDEGNLNWSFVMRKDEIGSIGVLKPYEYFGSLVSHALQEFGFQTRFTKPNRIDLNGSKISGMAAYFKAKAFLIHGTLLINTDLTILNRVCLAPEGAPPVTSLRQNLDSGLGIHDVALGIIDYIADRGKINTRGELSSSETRLIDRLYTKKYGLLSWNLGLQGQGGVFGSSPSSTLPIRPTSSLT